MIEVCEKHGVLSVVGAITPTEIMTALKLGANVIKVFPATSVGPGFFLEVLGPFPGTVLMAAGGMSLDNLADYVAAGAQVVTLLANGLDAAAYASGDGPAITRGAGLGRGRARRPAPRYFSTLRLTPEQYDLLFKVNVRAACFLIQRFVPGMIERLRSLVDELPGAPAWHSP